MLNAHRSGLKDVHLTSENLQFHLHLELKIAWAPPDGQHLSKAMAGAATLGRRVTRVGSRDVARLRQGRCGGGAGVAGCRGGARGACWAEGGLERAYVDGGIAEGLEGAREAIATGRHCLGR